MNPIRKAGMVMNARLSHNMLQNPGIRPVAVQSAALCYRIVDDDPQILLITTRRSRRWIIPKGWLIDGLTPSETAAQEAWEEAGVIGKCEHRTLGHYHYFKRRAGNGRALCQVSVFALPVMRLTTEFPEQGERRRKWFSPNTAALRVAVPELADLLRGFGPHHH